MQCFTAQRDPSASKGANASGPYAITYNEQSLLNMIEALKIRCSLLEMMVGQLVRKAADK